MNINSKLLMHPLDEDCDVEVEYYSWLTGFDNIDDADGLGVLYNDNNIKLYDKIEKDAKGMFISAYENIKSLFKEYYLKDIIIWVDAINFLHDRNTIAAYNHHNSNPQKGIYYFSVDWHTIINAKKKYIWEHELIHLFDHKFLMMLSVYNHSNEPIDKYKHYVLSYRAEGLADLYLLLKDNEYNEIKNINNARKQLRKNLEKTKDIIFSNRETKIDDLNTYDFYELGPWIILDIIKSYCLNNYEELINDVLNKLEHKQKIEDDIIYEIINIGIQIDIQIFLNYCETLLKENH